MRQWYKSCVSSLIIITRTRLPNHLLPPNGRPEPPLSSLSFSRDPSSARSPLEARGRGSVKEGERPTNKSFPHNLYHERGSWVRSGPTQPVPLGVHNQLIGTTTGWSMHINLYAYLYGERFDKVVRSYRNVVILCPPVKTSSFGVNWSPKLARIIRNMIQLVPFAMWDEMRWDEEQSRSVVGAKSIGCFPSDFARSFPFLLRVRPTPRNPAEYCSELVYEAPYESHVIRNLSVFLDSETI